MSKYYIAAPTGRGDATCTCTINLEYCTVWKVGNEMSGTFTIPWTVNHSQQQLLNLPTTVISALAESYRHLPNCANNEEQEGEGRQELQGDESPYSTCHYNILSSDQTKWKIPACLLLY